MLRILREPEKTPRSSIIITKNFFIMKTMFSVPAIMLLSMILLFSNCTQTQPEQAPAFDLAAAKATIEAANKVYVDAYNSADATALANCYTADGKFMMPGAPSLVGIEQIKAANEQGFAAGPTKLTLTTVEVWGDANYLTEEGTWVMNTPDGQKLDNGKFLVLWKNDNGAWKLHRDIFNSDNPPAPAQTAEAEK
jgi:uncharacterized protein (TIGR02246 family)